MSDLRMVEPRGIEPLTSAMPLKGDSTITAENGGFRCSASVNTEGTDREDRASLPHFCRTGGDRDAGAKPPPVDRDDDHGWAWARVRILERAKVMWAERELTFPPKTRVPWERGTEAAIAIALRDAAADLGISLQRARDTKTREVEIARLNTPAREVGQ